MKEMNYFLMFFRWLKTSTAYYHWVGINNPPLSVKISQLFSLGFYSFEISDKSRSGVLFFEVKIAQNFRALRARFCRFALTNAKITQKIGRFAPPGLYFLGASRQLFSRASILLKILPNVCFRGTVEGGVINYNSVVAFVFQNSSAS